MLYDIKVVFSEKKEIEDALYLLTSEFTIIVMRQLILSLLLLLGYASIQAQTLVCDPDSMYREGLVTDNETIFSKFSITNTLNIPVDFTWELIKVDIPEEWTWQVCDVNACYDLEAPPANAIRNSIGSGETKGNLGVNLSGHGGVPGHGYTTVRYFSLTDSIRSLGSINVEWNIMGDVATAEIVDHYLEVYPNPIDNRFQVRTDLTYDRITVYDLVGRNVEEYPYIENTSYDLSNISKGIYLIAFQKEDEVIHTKRIVKN